MQLTKKTVHVSFLCALFLLMDKVRYEGTMSIEAELEQPHAESAICARFPDLFEHPRHFQFMQDTMRLMVSGVQDTALLSFFAATAKRTFLDDGGEQESLWDCIWATLYAISSGNPPLMAVEFGRQAIPWNQRPSFDELEALLKSVRRGYRDQRAGGEEATRASMEQTIDALFAMLDMGK